MVDTIPAGTYPELPVEPDERSWLARNRRLVILLVSLIVLAAAALIWAQVATRQPIASNTTKTGPTNTKVQVVNTNVAGTYRRYTITQPPDQDHDGLTDAEEQQLGTNPTKADTDGDGLSDYDEVKIYHTNPLKADTDGDGVSDGAEVRQGTNPLGSGPLLNINSALHSSTK